MKSEIYYKAVDDVSKEKIITEAKDLKIAVLNIYETLGLFKLAEKIF